MQINSRYFIHPTKTESVLKGLYDHYIGRLPKKEVTTDAVVEDFYINNEDLLSVEQIYDLDQVKNDSFKGRPRRIRIKRESTNTTTYCETGYTSIIDLKNIMRFLNFLPIGSLTQLKTGFLLRDPLIEIPIVVNETREFGCFIEIGDAVGAIQDIDSLLSHLTRITRIEETDIVTESYGALLQRAKGLA